MTYSNLQRVATCTAMLLIGVFFVTIYSGCSEDNPTSSPTTGSIQGTVTDAVTGQPIGNTSILTNPPTQSVTTANDGTYTISGVVPGLYTVIPKASGYTVKTTDVQVVAGGIAQADLKLLNDGKDYVLNFDGTDDLVVIEDSPDLDLSTGSFTIEFYIRANKFNTAASSGNNDRWNCAVGHGTSNDDLDYLVGFENGNPMFYVRSYTSGFTSTTKLQKERWYHVAFVQDASNNKLKIYVDGALDSESPLQGTGVNTTGDIFVGAREYFNSGNGSHFFNGVIYELRMWNIARSQVDIKATLNTTLQGNEANLVGYWPLNDGTGTTVKDRSSGQRPGTIQGGIGWDRNESPLIP